MLSKWEDKRSGAPPNTNNANNNNNSAIPGATIGDHTSSSGDSTSANKYAADTNSYGNTSAGAGDGGYMPVAIPVTPTGGEFNTGGNRI